MFILKNIDVGWGADLITPTLEFADQKKEERDYPRKNVRDNSYINLAN